MFVVLQPDARSGRFALMCDPSNMSSVTEDHDDVFEVHQTKRDVWLAPTKLLELLGRNVRGDFVIL